MPVLQPAKNDQRHRGEVQQPSNDDEREGSAVPRLKGVTRETGMGDGEADYDEEEGEGGKEDGEELRVSLQGE
jgi:hypothetical protein